MKIVKKKIYNIYKNLLISGTKFTTNDSNEIFISKGLNNYFLLYEDSYSALRRFCIKENIFHCIRIYDIKILDNDN